MMKTIQDITYFSLSDASQLIGVSPNKIKEWELESNLHEAYDEERLIPPAKRILGETILPIELNSNGEIPVHAKRYWTAEEVEVIEQYAKKAN